MPSIKKRNGAIDFFKFIFAIIIILFHAQTFYNHDDKVIAPCGHLGVEFFFMVSAFLLAAKAEKFEGTDWLAESKKMIIHRITPIFPYMFLATMTGIAFYNFWQLDLNGVSHHLYLCIPEMFGLQMFGYPGSWITGVSWYLSALFIISAATYPILLRKKSRFTSWVAPLTALFVWGYLHNKSGALNRPGDWWDPFYKGLLRGYASMAFGYTAYEICKWINNSPAPVGIIRRARLLFLEIGSFFVAIAYALLHKKPDSYDYIIPLFLMFGIAVCFSNKGVLQKVFCHRIWNFLGEFSLSIYLNHYYIKENIPRLFHAYSHEQQLLYFVGLVFIVALFNHFAGKLLAKYLKTIEAQVTLALFVTAVGFVMPFLLDKI